MTYDNAWAIRTDDTLGIRALLLACVVASDRKNNPACMIWRAISPASLNYYTSTVPKPAGCWRGLLPLLLPPDAFICGSLLRCFGISVEQYALATVAAANDVAVRLYSVNITGGGLPRDAKTATFFSSTVQRRVLLAHNAC